MKKLFIILSLLIPYSIIAQGINNGGGIIASGQPTSGGGGAPSGAAGGALSGTYPNPTLANPVAVNTITAITETISNRSTISNLIVGNIISTSSNGFTGPGTIGITSSVVTGSSTTFTSTFLSNKVFSCNGTFYHIIYINTDTTMHVIESVNQTAGLNYTVLPASLSSYPTNGASLTGASGSFIDAQGSIFITSAGGLPGLYIGDGNIDYGGVSFNHNAAQFQINSYSNGIVNTTPFAIADGAANGAFSINQAGIVSFGSGAIIPGFSSNVVGAPIPVIIDDDAGGDPDGLIEAQVAFGMQQLGFINILAFTSCALSSRTNIGISADEIVGNYYGIYPDYGSTTNTAAYNNVQSQLVLTNYYTRIGATTNAPNATTVLRRTLANYKGSNQIAMLFTGQPVDLKDLLNSGADSYSPLTGQQLVSNKVAYCVAVMGDYPSGNEFNLNTVPASDDCFSNKWPVNIPIYWLGSILGASVTNAVLPWITNLAGRSPVVDVFANNSYLGNGRSSWGSMGVLATVFGTNNIGSYNLFGTVQGSNIINITTGTNGWVTNTTQNQFYLTTTNTAGISNLVNFFSVVRPNQVASDREMQLSGYTNSDLWIKTQPTNGNGILFDCEFENGLQPWNNDRGTFTNVGSSFGFFNIGTANGVNFNSTNPIIMGTSSMQLGTAVGSWGGLGFTNINGSTYATTTPMEQHAKFNFPVVPTGQINLMKWVSAKFSDNSDVATVIVRSDGRWEIFVSGGVGIAALTNVIQAGVTYDVYGFFQGTGAGAGGSIAVSTNGTRPVSGVNFTNVSGTVSTVVNGFAIENQNSGFIVNVDNWIVSTNTIVAQIQPIQTNSIAVLSFPATTVNFTNQWPFPGVVYVDNSGVTGTVVKQNGTQIFSSLVGDSTLYLNPGDTFSETYTLGNPVGIFKPAINWAR